MTAEVPVNDRLDPSTPSGPPPDVAPPATTGRRRVLRRIAISALVGLIAGPAIWWQRTVTADPGLVFDGGANVFRNAPGGDLTGITRVWNSFGTDVDVDREAGAPLHAFFRLSNHGQRTVRIEAVPPRGFYYWGFDGAVVSPDPHALFAGADATQLRPFSLGPGESRAVRLDFHQASCDPAGLQEGFSRINALPVRYRILGHTRTATAPLGEVTIAVHTSGICDRPITDH
jgi:hypothetical protein